MCDNLGIYFMPILLPYHFPMRHRRFSHFSHSQTITSFSVILHTFETNEPSRERRWWNFITPSEASREFQRQYFRRIIRKWIEEYSTCSYERENLQTLLRFSGALAPHVLPRPHRGNAITGFPLLAIASGMQHFAIRCAFRQHSNTWWAKQAILAAYSNTCRRFFSWLGTSMEQSRPTNSHLAFSRLPSFIRIRKLGGFRIKTEIISVIFDTIALHSTSVIVTHVHFFPMAWEWATLS